jgi:uncharacterized protein YfkK (UPF0435 family)
MAEISGGLFISWSGDISHAVAEQLKGWIPLVFSGPRCWLSTRDLPAGRVWVTELFEQLQVCNVGVIVLTPDNVNSSWMLFEAGALCKNLKISRVLPYLVGIKKRDLRGPFAEFQAIEATQDGTRQLIHSIREVYSSSESQAIADQRFDAFWPILSRQLEASQKLLSKSSPQPIGSVTDYQFAVKHLESQVASLTDMIRDLVQKASLNLQSNIPTTSPLPQLEQLVGAWRNPVSGSYGYARLVNGALYMPYCYGGNDTLTAHYTNWSLIGEHWFGRFQWFDGTFRGFSIYKLMNDNLLSGFWWPTYLDLSQSEIEEIARRGWHPEAIDTEWIRINTNSVPDWAERYFSELEHCSRT